MIFSSAEFLFLFLPCVLLVYYNPFFRGRRFRNIFLLLVSLFFYAWGEPVNVVLLLASIAANWFFGRMVEGEGPRRRFWLWAAVVLNLAGLFIFKYLGFVCRNLGALGLPMPEIDLALPIGISFYTFQAMSYVIDVYRRRSPAQRSVLDVGLYVSFFPQLIAGPIVRYETIAQEIHGRRETWEDFRSGVPRFIAGLGKKVILSNNMAILADAAFDTLPSLSAPMAWLGAVAYGLQIYFDFSGYSDMAIGMGRMFGFHFLENFDRPYLATSITDFWRRWHISLSTWFRDYVYIPLGGNRVSAGRHLFNLFVVWLLTGIWHGANWTFLLWGLGYFLLLMAEKYGHIDRRLGVLRRPWTLFWVLMLWVLFRAENVAAAGDYFAALFTGGRGDINDFLYYFGNMKFYLAAAVACCLPWDKLWRRVPEAPRACLSAAGSVAVLLLVLTYVVGSTYNPFIYFNF